MATFKWPKEEGTSAPAYRVCIWTRKRDPASRVTYRYAALADALNVAQHFIGRKAGYKVVVYAPGGEIVKREELP